LQTFQPELLLAFPRTPVGARGSAFDQLHRGINFVLYGMMRRYAGPLETDAAANAALGALARHVPGRLLAQGHWFFGNGFRDRSGASWWRGTTVAAGLAFALRRLRARGGVARHRSPVQRKLKR
jgi:hypothetical protein